MGRLSFRRRWYVVLLWVGVPVCVGLGAVSENASMAYATVTYKVKAADVTDASRTALEKAADRARDAGLTVEAGGDATDSGGGPSGVAEIIGIAPAAAVLLITVRPPVPTASAPCSTGSEPWRTRPASLAVRRTRHPARVKKQPLNRIDAGGEPGFKRWRLGGAAPVVALPCHRSDGRTLNRPSS
nr:MMPL family transporter [Streptomyces sp. SID12488]